MYGFQKRAGHIDQRDHLVYTAPHPNPHQYLLQHSEAIPAPYDNPLQTTVIPRKRLYHWRSSEYHERVNQKRQFYQMEYCVAAMQCIRQYRSLSRGC